MTEPWRSRGWAAIVVCGAAVLGCRESRSRSQDAGGGDAADEPTEAAAAFIPEAPPPDDSIPQPSSEELTVRARHLLEAIAKDESELATDMLFPRDGWLATRDALDPGKEWEKHIANPFRRAVHSLIRQHQDLERAQFAALELGHTVVQATPRRRGWRKPLWTVRDSHLTFVVDGHTRTLPIREMTAWRGAWYVTRLR